MCEDAMKELEKLVGKSEEMIKKDHQNLCDEIIDVLSKYNPNIALAAMMHVIISGFTGTKEHFLKMSESILDEKIKFYGEDGHGKDAN